MNLWLQRCLLPLFLLLVTSPRTAAAEVTTASRSAPQPRPRLTEALRAKVETERQSTAHGAAIKMEKVIVREARLASGPAKDEKSEGPFSITQGGYLLKNRGERFSTEIGLW